MRNEDSIEAPRGLGRLDGAEHEAGGTAVVSFYRFVRLDALDDLRCWIAGLADAAQLRGTVLLAEEGINATLCGTSDALAQFVAALEVDERFADMPLKYSKAAVGNPVFYRLKVRVKPEIVTFGPPGIDVENRTGEHVDARRWNELLDDPEVALVDVRNHYEIGVGAFPGAIDPGIEHFRDFPDFARTHLDPKNQPKVAMYCTGGIRCEKAAAWLLNEGHAQVFQLDGGILRYLETAPEDDIRWQGECFVFDQRVSVDAELGQGTFQLCFACRAPLSADELASPRYRRGIHCPHCFDEQTEQQRAGLEMRQKQVELAEARGSGISGVRASSNTRARSFQPGVPGRRRTRNSNRGSKKSWVAVFPFRRVKAHYRPPRTEGRRCGKPEGEHRHPTRGEVVDFLRRRLRVHRARRR